MTDASRESPASGGLPGGPETNKDNAHAVRAPARARIGTEVVFDVSVAPGAGPFPRPPAWVTVSLLAAAAVATVVVVRRVAENGWRVTYAMQREMQVALGHVLALSAVTVLARTVLDLGVIPALIDGVLVGSGTVAGLQRLRPLRRLDASDGCLVRWTALLVAGFVLQASGFLQGPVRYVTGLVVAVSLWMSVYVIGAEVGSLDVGPLVEEGHGDE